MHLINAWAAQNRLVLGQVTVDDKSNEITAIPQLLELLDLRGSTVTIDPLGCQTATAELSVGQGGNYILALKGNHPRMLNDVATLFADAHTAIQAEYGLTSARSVDVGMGRNAPGIRDQRATGDCVSERRQALSGTPERRTD